MLRFVTGRMAAVAFDLMSLPEVAGDAALYFGPLDVDDIAAQLRRCLTDDALRQELVRRGLAQAARFRWEDTARRTWAAFEQMLR